MKKRNFSQKAFTMVELLLAIFIMEIGILGIAGFYAYSTGVTKLARQETTASNLASGLLDEQLALSYSQLATISKTGYSSDPANPLSQYSKQVDITCLDGNLADILCTSQPTPHMKKILVTITWQYNGGERKFQEATIMAEQ